MSNNPPISFQEALDLMDSLPMEEAVNDERIANFIASVDCAGADILRDVDEEKLLGAIAFIQSAATGIMVQESLRKGDIVEVMEIMNMANSTTFSKLITVAFKISVGLSALEEWK